MRRSNEKHGYYYTNEYKIYHGMKTRCYNKNSVSYVNYGGRGIRVCDRWLESFENFLSDMGKKPSLDHSIDREDNDGDYSPENCRWATASEQSSNRRDAVRIVYNGITGSPSEWEEITGIPARTIYNRIHKLKWGDKKAVTTPVNVNLRRCIGK